MLTHVSTRLSEAKPKLSRVNYMLFKVNRKLTQIQPKLPNVKPAVVYDPEFTAGRYGVYVEADASRLEEARAIMNAEEPVELREGEADA